MSFFSYFKINSSHNREWFSKPVRVKHLSPDTIHQAAEVFASETRKRREMEILNATNVRRKENRIKKVEKPASPIITNHYAPPAEQFLESRRHDIRPQEWDTRREDLEKALKPSASFKIYSRATTPTSRPKSVLEDVLSVVGINNDMDSSSEDSSTQKLYFIDVSPINIQLPMKNVGNIVVEEEKNELPYVTGDWTKSSRSASRASNRIAEVYMRKNERAARIRSARARSPEAVQPVVEIIKEMPKKNYFADSNGKSCAVKTEPSGGIMDRSSRAASAYKCRKSDYLSTSMPEYHALEIYEVKLQSNFSKTKSSKSLKSHGHSMQKLGDEFGSKRSIKSAPSYKSMTDNSARKLFSGSTMFSSDNIHSNNILKGYRNQPKKAMQLEPDLKDFKEIVLHSEIEKLDSMLTKLGR
ncbi:hypothetical protein HDV01_007427 [Terramyces sp. JEL0728]|nr:hypothetical protein HDV01_007427 [Terramyces sp. JEL0728]